MRLIGSTLLYTHGVHFRTLFLEIKGVRLISATLSLSSTIKYYIQSNPSSYLKHCYSVLVFSLLAQTQMLA